MIDKNAAWRALKSHDRRFDGVFFVGVISTGIYCRPVCPAKTPLPENCLFFTRPEAAEKALFRPCLRCRPELAPGNAPIDNAHRIADLLLQRIDEGLEEENNSLEQVAARFSISSRQLRRIIKEELGVSPFELRQTRRLLLAKQLLTETTLSVTDIAFASGFSSVRRFNDVFSQQYRMSPSRLRKEIQVDRPLTLQAETSTLQLSYRPPYDWEAMLEFLSLRAIKEIELVDATSYSRTLRLGEATGWIRVTHAPQKNALMVEFTHSLTSALPAMLQRLRHVFDLSARPDLISAHLQQDPLLSESLIKNPGLRVPGAVDGFEMTIRAILGQQITVKAATTLAGRFAEAFGEKIVTPFPELSRLSPLPSHVAEASIDEIARLGIVSRRATCIHEIARACHSGELWLASGTDPEKTIRQLIMLPGIGQWTAHYIAMRALRWPDAFPRDDIVIRNNLGGISAKQAEKVSLSWSPWRSYAVMHIWKNLSKRSSTALPETIQAVPVQKVQN
ncbi:Ada [[Pantoea] beijingensis]|uniref:DNA-3-methyladenine glycosylase II n=1 Tax=[Pantoea] beijingensis TaxID=1324864 RepID=A0A443IAL5_9GAMM|nr:MULTISPECIES: AlkA N-terminal domain-containing protein [Erwiniaceae]RWR01093.1 Ada [[Pantoea] beijingensis]